MPPPAANVPTSHALRNPKRRQRNASEDSAAFRHNPKRLRRSEVTDNTFEPPDSVKTNGHVKTQNNSPLANGHANSSKQRDASSDTASLVIRNRGLKKVERGKKGSKEEGTVLVGHVRYTNLSWQKLMRRPRPKTISILYPSYILHLTGSKTNKVQVSGNSLQSSTV